MTARFVQWARSESQFKAMRADGWECDTAQPHTHHHEYSVLMHWDHADRDPPSSAPDQSHFHGATP